LEGQVFDIMVGAMIEQGLEDRVSLRFMIVGGAMTINWGQ
jgi:hypothetical protein